MIRKIRLDNRSNIYNGPLDLWRGRCYYEQPKRLRSEQYSISLWMSPEPSDAARVIYGYSVEYGVRNPSPG